MSQLAVVVVTHNSARVLADTVRALTPQLRDDDELIVVDCGSNDNPGAVLRELAPAARLVELGDNRGFAGGAVVGAEHSTAPLLFFLNPDATPSPGCLRALREAGDAEPGWGAWQALVLLPGGLRVNSRGGVAHYLGFGWAGGHEEPAADVPQRLAEVGFGSGAAMVVRRSAWSDVGGFDPAFFMYGEDLDLSLRLRLAAWGVGIAPSARVVHEYEFHKGEYKWFHLERNRWWTLIGTYPWPLLVMLTPALLAAEVALLCVAARGGWLRAKLRAQAAVIRTLPMARRRRVTIQATRRNGPATFAGALSASLDSPYLGAVAQVAGVRALQAGYWQAVLRAVRD